MSIFSNAPGNLKSELYQFDAKNLESEHIASSGNLNLAMLHRNHGEDRLYSGRTDPGMLQNIDVTRARKLLPLNDLELQNNGIVPNALFIAEQAPAAITQGLSNSPVADSAMAAGQNPDPGVVVPAVQAAVSQAVSQAETIQLGGRDGLDGIMLSGMPSLPGLPGVSGLDGRAGHDGRDGRDGQDGRDGRDGRDGTNGRDGCHGDDGDDGSCGGGGGHGGGHGCGPHGGDHCGDHGGGICLLPDIILDPGAIVGMVLGGVNTILDTTLMARGLACLRSGHTARQPWVSVGSARPGSTSRRPAPERVQPYRPAGVPAP